MYKAFALAAIVAMTGAIRLGQEDQGEDVDFQDILDFFEDNQDTELPLALMPDMDDADMDDGEMMDDEYAMSGEPMGRGRWEDKPERGAWGRGKWESREDREEGGRGKWADKPERENRGRGRWTK